MSRKIQVAVLGMAGVLALSACAGTTKKSAGAPSSAASSSSSSSAAAAPAPASESPSPTPSPTKDKSSYTNMALGSPISVTGKGSDGDFAYSVTAGPAQTSTKAVSQYGEKPKNTYVGVTVLYDCTAGSCDYNPFDFTLRSADGTEVDQSFTGFEPSLHSGSLNTGTKAKGVITYDLPAGQYSLEYRTNALDGDAASWVLPVA